MTRSPLFYPMHRGDSDPGGAADLQTDIMRFMAILALCLVAIFALVQSIPLIPEAPAQSAATAAPPLQVPQDEPRATASSEPPKPADAPVASRPEQNVVLTRPKWESSFAARQSTLPAAAESMSQRAAEPEPETAAEAAITAPPRPTEPPERGYSLRFESDLALTRLVAAGNVGLFAIGAGRAQRMTVLDSRISFWDASTPRSFHEMEASTVPASVIDALARSGSNTTGVKWGVTLPGKLSQQLTRLMHEHDGGALVIGLDGQLRREAS